MPDTDATEHVSLDNLAEGSRQSLFEAGPRTVRLALDAGEDVPAHRHSDRNIVCHLVAGELVLGLGSETVALSAGEVVRFDGDQDISLRAETDCEALLVLSPAV
ncbi:cupin domain-containing protein [Halomicroarcula sp. GCM10025324]|uniref:cupin domain-containing protein n=1 Tax=Haloarcula TaxID=2237 RepID=UPI0023E82D4A|nr:cupin domain-containing protein [Halomicroarcula sp. ZS-22-S1]